MYTTALLLCSILALRPNAGGQPSYGRGPSACADVCRDLPPGDTQPVCMMFSRYKRSYEHFANMCHARRAICQDNLFLHLVHPSRCMHNRLYFMPLGHADNNR